MDFTLIGEVEARDTDLEKVRHQGEVMPYVMEFLNDMAQIEAKIENLKQAAKEEFKAYGINLIF